MTSTSNGWLRRSLMTCVYALGVFGILASGDGSDGDDIRAFTCGLSVRGIAPVGDGTVWVGVFAKTNTNTEDRVVLLDSDGSELDSYFIGDGGSENAIRAVALDALGNIYVGGDFSGGILRLRAADGSPDPVFDQVGTGFNGRVTSIVPLANGQLYVGGFFSDYNGTGISGLVRLNNNGLLDNGFGGTGAVLAQDVESVAMSGPDATFDVYGGGESNPRIERWESDGDPSPVFTPALGAGSVLNVTPADLLGFNAGDIYLGGAFGNRIIRLSSTGTPDGLFSVDAGFDANVASIALATLDKIYVGGEFTTYKGVSANGVVRLNNDGIRDMGFNVGSGFTDPNGVFPLSTAASMAKDGMSLYVGGGFTQYKGTASNGIVLLNSVGDLNGAFDVSITIDGEVCDSQTIPD